MLLLTIQDKDFILATLTRSGFFLKYPNKTVFFNTYKCQENRIKLGVGRISIFDKTVSTKSYTQTFSCLSSVMTKGKNLPLNYCQATAFKL
jgi:hypothetical protein